MVQCTTLTVSNPLPTIGKDALSFVTLINNAVTLPSVCTGELWVGKTVGVQVNLSASANAYVDVSIKYYQGTTARTLSTTNLALSAGNNYAVLMDSLVYSVLYTYTAALTDVVISNIKAR